MKIKAILRLLVACLLFCHAEARAQVLTTVTWGVGRGTPTAAPVCLMQNGNCLVQIGVANLTTGAWAPSGAGAGLTGSANAWAFAQTYSVAPIFTTLTGFVYANGAGAVTAATTIPATALSNGVIGTGAVPLASAFPGLSTNVESTGLAGLDDGNWFIYQAPTTAVGAANPALRIQRNATYTNHFAITGASGTGATATFTYTLGGVPGPAIPLGHTISISGEQPWGYNVSCVVSASSTGSVSCPNTTTGAQTVAGTFWDVTANFSDTVQALWVLADSSPIGSYFEWPFTAQMNNNTGVILGDGAQNLALNSTVTKQYLAGYNYQIAAFTGVMTGTTTLTVTAIASGFLSPSNILNSASITTKPYIVAQLTSTETGGVLGGRGTYQLSQSLTFLSQAITATDQIGPTWAGNFVCADYTGVKDPSASCLGLEIDNYYSSGVGTDANAQRVGIQVVVAGNSGPTAGAGDHVGLGIVMGSYDLSTIDEALEFNGAGSYGDIIDVRFATINGYIINAANFSLDGLGNVATYGDVTAATYHAGASAGVTCTGTPTSSFASVKGIVTHC